MSDRYASILLALFLATLVQKSQMLSMPNEKNHMATYPTRGSFMARKLEKTDTKKTVVTPKPCSMARLLTMDTRKPTKRGSLVAIFPMCSSMYRSQNDFLLDGKSLFVANKSALRTTPNLFSECLRLSWEEALWRSLPPNTAVLQLCAAELQTATYPPFVSRSRVSLARRRGCRQVSPEVFFLSVPCLSPCPTTKECWDSSGQRLKAWRLYCQLTLCGYGCSYATAMSQPLSIVEQDDVLIIF